MFLSQLTAPKQGPWFLGAWRLLSCDGHRTPRGLSQCPHTDTTKAPGGAHCSLLFRPPSTPHGGSIVPTPVPRIWSATMIASFPMNITTSLSREKLSSFQEVDEIMWPPSVRHHLCRAGKNPALPSHPEIPPLHSDMSMPAHTWGPNYYTHGTNHKRLGVRNCNSSSRLPLF